ncbi:alpha/beta fold hydrolase [Pendulispora rubella]|uniref:Alpha/beta fold hydrolase n=1 Tax=Pendulispora rubella TaxID=2741070 RepID=A0ABZ2L7D3_9BACT
MNLFCFSYAGGSAQSYFGLKQALSGPKAILLELPGRGMRFREPLLTSMEAVLDEYERQMQPQLERAEPFAFFGHSMGALVAHLLTLRFAARGLPGPSHLFLSGKSGPGCAPATTPKHLLTQSEFRAYLEILGGCPRVVLADEELMQHFCRVVRADFEVLETCDERADARHVIPLTAFAGDEDAITPDLVRGWHKVAAAGWDVHVLRGGHFFLQSHWPGIARIIERALATPRLTAAQPTA